MVRIEKNHWYVHGDTLSISLMRFHARILMEIDDIYETPVFVVTINDSNMDETTLEFAYLETAIDFVENYLVDARELTEVPMIYEYYTLGEDDRKRDNNYIKSLSLRKE